MENFTQPKFWTENELQHRNNFILLNNEIFIFLSLLKMIKNILSIFLPTLNQS